MAGARRLEATRCERPEASRAHRSAIGEKIVWVNLARPNWARSPNFQSSERPRFTPGRANGALHRRLELNTSPDTSWSPRLRHRDAAQHYLRKSTSGRRHDNNAGRAPFSPAPFQCVRFCCGRAGVSPQCFVGQIALPPAPVLGYSPTAISGAPT